MPAYKINTGLIAQKLEGKTVFFDGDKSILYTLNETASFIFKKIKAKVPPEKIKELLVKQYEVTETRAKKDLDIFIKDLSAKKIILPVK